MSKSKKKSKNSINPLVAWMFRDKSLSKPYPPWMFVGHTPYLILVITGIIQSWGWKQFLILGGFYLPYALCIISWFARQRKQEKLLQKLLEREDIDTLEIENNPIIGSLKFSTRSSLPQKTSNKNK